MTTKQLTWQVGQAIIEAWAYSRHYSEIQSQWVRRGGGVMSQQTFADQQAKREAF